MDTPKAPRAPVPPKAPKAGTGSHMIDILPIPRKGGRSIRYHEFELDTLGEPEKTKSDKKSGTSRRRSSISWPGSTDPTLVNQQRDSGIRRL